MRLETQLLRTTYWTPGRGYMGSIYLFAHDAERLHKIGFRLVRSLSNLVSDFRLRKNVFIIYVGGNYLDEKGEHDLTAMNKYEIYNTAVKIVKQKLNATQVAM